MVHLDPSLLLSKPKARFKHLYRTMGLCHSTEGQFPFHESTLEREACINMRYGRNNCFKSGRLCHSGTVNSWWRRNTAFYHVETFYFPPSPWETWSGSFATRFTTLWGEALFLLPLNRLFLIHSIPLSLVIYRTSVCVCVCVCFYTVLYNGSELSS